MCGALWRCELGTYFSAALYGSGGAPAIVVEVHPSPRMAIRLSCSSCFRGQQCQLGQPACGVLVGIGHG